MNFEMEDDFERFCRIGKGSSYDNGGSAQNQISSCFPERRRRSQRSTKSRDFLAAPTELSRNRAGSLRESSDRYCRTSRLDVSPQTNLSVGHRDASREESMHHPSTASRRHSLAPSFQTNERSIQLLSPRSRTQYYEPPFDTPGPVCISNVARRDRASPAIRKTSAGNSLPPPIKVFSDDSQEDGISVVRVRSFRRTKNGVINEGDRDIVQQMSFSGNLAKPEICESLNISDEREPVEAFSKSYTGHLRRISTSQSRLKKLSSHHDMQTLDKMEAARAIRRKSCTQSWSNSEHSDLDNQRSISRTGSGNGIQQKVYTVQVLGASQTGKSTMCTQFLSSEAVDDLGDMHSDQESLETVTVDVDGEQTSLLLFDSGINSENSVIAAADAYLVVYAVDDRDSFNEAQVLISEILGQSKMSSAIVLVGNKSDLVRARVVTTEEGKCLARVYSCSFFEVSISLNHKVDDLLVGLVSAIKSANQCVVEEQQRLSRIASIKTHTGGGVSGRSSSPNIDLSPRPNGGQHHKRPHLKNSIQNFFRRHFNAGPQSPESPCS